MNPDKHLARPAPLRDAPAVRASPAPGWPVQPLAAPPARFRPAPCPLPWRASDRSAVAVVTGQVLRVVRTLRLAAPTLAFSSCLFF